ncbi:MAG: GNAT family N-acetyltransferase [Oscillospiraceae bacterium]|jgi:ribosomal protein S18 acetylase RimI-like enzyme|nr:GNAT family N-acetyltransferase [Oscillospiraceae bacterium]
MREDILIREARIRDAPYIKRLWQSVFNDPEEILGAFFEVYVDVRLCVLAQLGARLAAFGLLLPAGEYVHSDGRREQCAMMYAVATDPEFRGLGCASLVTRELLRVGAKHGFGIVALRPASEALFDFYAKNGLYESFYCREYTVSAPELQSARGALPAVTRAAPEAYLARREALLSGAAHIAFDRRALSFQERLYRGGGLLFVGDGCAAVEPSSGRVCVSELLCADGDAPAALAALAEIFPSEVYTVREPGGDTRFGMANIRAERGYMGFTFG